MDQLAQIGRLFDAAALGAVIGGSLLAALLRGGRRSFGPALAALKQLFVADPEADAHAARVAVAHAEEIAEAKSFVCVDRVETTGRFLKEAVRKLSDARSSEGFARWAAETLDSRRRRHEGRAAFWRDVADAAPAMGMIATVLGLVRMFAAMDDPAHIGAPMATALIATLWGIVVANLIAGPIAERLERLSTAELAWQERTLNHLVSLARAELDRAQGLQRVLARNFTA